MHQVYLMSGDLLAVSISMKMMTDMGRQRSREGSSADNAYSFCFCRRQWKNSEDPDVRCMKFRAMPCICGCTK
jgi:hypothetical protein